jgi:hypothetical protein
MLSESVCSLYAVLNEKEMSLDCLDPVKVAVMSKDDTLASIKRYIYMNLIQINVTKLWAVPDFLTLLQPLVDPKTMKLMCFK